MRSRNTALSTILLAGVFAGIAACGGADDLGSSVDDATEIPYAEGSPEAKAILTVANDQSYDFTYYDDVIGLHKKAAENLIAHREGEDLESAEDDNLFDDLGELWSVSYCKTSCFDALLAHAKETGVYGGNEKVSVVFSPQAADQTHLVHIADAIDGATETIDIAMYSYSHQDPIRSALERAVDRGVVIRMLADTDLATSSSKAGPLEAMGIDVRRVTKIMHHKFAIIDGPRTESTHDRAGSATLISGSGNWSGSAGTIYDENTLFMNGYPEMALRLQRDFDTIWAGSKDVVHNDALVWDETNANITDEVVAAHDGPDTHAYFTSVNFKSTSSQGWSYLGTTAVTDQLIHAILTAESSIHIASGHFVSVPIADAVLTALETNPSLTVDIVLDCQEVSKWGDIATIKRDIEELGGTINYKCNTSRWHYKFAKQMHHKYLLIDGDELYTGSMNLSDNAETNTFENMLWFSGEEHAPLIDTYFTNFFMVKSYGTENENAALQALREEIETGNMIPLTWYQPISMSKDTYYDLKDLIAENCPAASSSDDSGAAKTYDKYFNQQPHWFDECARTGYPWPEVPESMRVPD